MPNGFSNTGNFVCNSNAVTASRRFSNRRIHYSRMFSSVFNKLHEPSSSTLRRISSECAN